MSVEEKLIQIRDELAEIYHSSNDAPRLIAEMLKEFPYPRGKNCEKGLPMSHNLR